MYLNLKCFICEWSCSIRTYYSYRSAAQPTKKLWWFITFISYFSLFISISIKTANFKFSFIFVNLYQTSINNNCHDWLTGGVLKKGVGYVSTPPPPGNINQMQPPGLDILLHAPLKYVLHHKAHSTHLNVCITPPWS